jgi:cytochrome c-type biogenesis protein CcmH/NrfG
MGKKTEPMVQKQTLYIAILVAVTFGFMLGATYTSFKLAPDQDNAMQGPGMPPGPGNTGKAQAEVDHGARILELEALVKDQPENVQAWVALGNTFFDSHRYKDAIEAYEKSLALAPADPHVLTDLGIMYRRDNNPEKAVKSFDRAIKADPDFETARFNKGIVLMHDLEDLPGAIRAWEALVKVNPMAHAPDGQLINTLIQGLKQQQK